MLLLFFTGKNVSDPFFSSSFEILFPFSYFCHHSRHPFLLNKNHRNWQNSWWEYFCLLLLPHFFPFHILLPIFEAYLFVPVVILFLPGRFISIKNVRDEEKDTRDSSLLALSSGCVVILASSSCCDIVSILCIIFFWCSIGAYSDLDSYQWMIQYRLCTWDDSGDLHTRIRSKTLEQWFTFKAWCLNFPPVVNMTDQDSRLVKNSVDMNLPCMSKKKVGFYFQSRRQLLMTSWTIPVLLTLLGKEIPGAWLKIDIQDASFDTNLNACLLFT